MNEMTATAIELLHETAFDEGAFDAPAGPAAGERGADWALAVPFFGVALAMYGGIGVVLYSVIA